MVLLLLARTRELVLPLTPTPPPPPLAYSTTTTQAGLTGLGRDPLSILVNLSARVKGACCGEGGRFSGSLPSMPSMPSMPAWTKGKGAWKGAGGGGGEKYASQRDV